MSCIKIYGQVNRNEDSILFQDLKRKYNEEKATHIYENVIHSQSELDYSFYNWFNELKEPYLTEQEEPTIETVENWLQFVDKRAKLDKTFITNDFIATPNEFIDLSEGFSHYVMNSLLDKKGLSPTALLSMNSSSVRNVLNKALDSLLNRLENTKEQSFNPERHQEIIDAISSNKVMFYKSFNNYIKTKLKINFNLETVLSDEIETKEDKNTKDSAFNKSSIEFDTKDGAPSSVKLLISSLPKVEITTEGMTTVSNDLGLPKLVDYNDTFNYIQQKLLNIPSDINVISEEILRLSKFRPELKILHKRLNFNKSSYAIPSDNIQKIVETELRTQFVNQFNKTKLDFALHIVSEDGNVKIINANQDNIKSKIINEWKSGFEIKMNNPNFIKNSAYLQKATTKQVLNFLGIELPSGTQIDSELISEIVKYGLDNEANIRNVFSNQSTIKGQLNKLAELVILEGDNVVDFQQFNVENKLVYAITLNSYITTLAKKLSHFSGNENALYENFPELFMGTYAQDSIILNNLLKGNKLRVGLYDGIKSEANKGSGKASKELKSKDLILQRLNGLLLEGYYTFPRTADRGVEYYIHIDGVKEPMVDTIRNAKNYYKSHLKAELEVMQIKNTGVSFFDENNKKSRVFSYTNEHGDVVSLNLEGLTPDNVSTDENVDSFLDDMIKNIIRIEEEFLTKNEVLSKNGSTYENIQELVDKYGSKEAVVNLYALNYHISNIEMSKVFTGDLAFYKKPSDVFKRTSMMNSTKESLRTDPEMNRVLNTVEYAFEKQQGYNYSKQHIGDNKIKTITINDIKGNMLEGFTKEEKDTLVEVLGKESAEIKDYTSMDEADGFAYVTYDEYKRMLMRAGEWTAKDEKLYQAIAKGDYSYNTDTVHKQTMKKYQYTGKLFNQDLLDAGLNVPAGRKFAFLPLIPGLIPANSVLQKLNEQMLSQGVGMAFMTSAAKFGYTNAYDMYNSSGQFNIELNEDSPLDILDYEYMGNQLKIHNKPKTKISGTQRTKIIKGNFYENGQPLNDEVGELLNTYEELQIEKAKKSFKKLLTKLNIDQETFNINDPVQISGFIDNLINQGLIQDYNTNELKALELLLHLPVFEVLPNKSKLESLITSTLKKNAIDNKRKGDMLAQASDVGFENVDNNGNRHNLKFYRYSKEINGERVLLPMEIMVPLPNELMQYVIDKYGDGNNLTEADLEAFNEDIAKDDARFEETLKETTLTKIRTYSGFRIPTQDASSLDVARIKKFLMPHTTGLVVVPKAIVAKTGSDFDIDKINFIIPHYKMIKSNKPIIKKFFKNKNLDYKKLNKILKNEFGITSSNPQEDVYNLILSVPSVEVENAQLKLLSDEYKKFEKSENVKVTGFKLLDTNKPVSEMNDEEISNKLLETEIALTLNKENHKKLLTPLTEHIIRGIVADIRKDTGIAGQQEHFHEAFYGKTNIDKFIAFLSGKAGVGQVAVHITNHILAQQANLKMKALHNYFGVSENSLIDLAKTESNGYNISQVLSELITAYVDIAKDPYILDINAVNATANTILMMVRWGVEPKSIFYFMNQPIIKEYLRERELAESVTTFNSDSKKDTVNKVLMKFGITHKKYSDLISTIENKIEDGDTELERVPEGIYPDIQFSTLRKEIKNYADNNKSTPDVQLQMLDLFLEYQRQSKEFQKMIRSVSPDTQVFKNMTILESQINLKNEVKEAGMFENYDKLFESFIGEYYSNKKMYFDLIKNMFISQNPNIKPQLDALKDSYLSNVIGENEKTKWSNQIDNELVNFMLSQNGLIKYDSFKKSLFEGENSLPKLMLKVKEFYKEQGFENSFIEEIQPLINYNNQGYDSMRLATKKLSDSQREKLIADFEALTSPEYTEWINNTFGTKYKNFGVVLWAYNMMQSSINNSPFSYISVIPSNLHFNMVSQILEDFLKSPNSIGMEKFTGFGTDGKLKTIGEFVLNNPGPLFKKYNLGYSVKFSPEFQDFYIKFEGENIRRKGSYNLKEYFTQNKNINTNNAISTDFNSAIDNLKC